MAKKIMEKDKDYYIKHIIKLCEDKKFRITDFTPDVFNMGFGKVRLCRDKIVVFSKDEKNGLGVTELPLTKDEFDAIVKQICLWEKID